LKGPQTAAPFVSIQRKFPTIIKGADRNYLRAKVFGGASIFKKDEQVGNFMCVGAVNCRFIREFLANKNIPLDAENTGRRTRAYHSFLERRFHGLPTKDREIPQSSARSPRQAILATSDWVFEYEYWQARG
jgi:hypothetical protein